MSKLKICIVEDDKSTQLLYDRALSSDIFEKRFSPNGQEALEVYDTWNPDIILLDVFMPVMTGYSVLRVIRDHVKDQKTTIILATSMSSTDDIDDFRKFGFQGLILKPFNYSELSNRILEYHIAHQGSSSEKLEPEANAPVIGTDPEAV